MGENIGKIIQVLGPVVDVEFEQGNLPTIYTALTISNPAISDEEDNLVVEVAQHLGDNVVRTIAMDVTDGLMRGQDVKDTGKPIMMPVSPAMDIALAMIKSDRTGTWAMGPVQGPSSSAIWGITPEASVFRKNISPYPANELTPS